MNVKTRSSAQAFVSAPRENSAWTAALEKRLLIWMAERTPAWIGSDHLTALAFVSQLLPRV